MTTITLSILLLVTFNIYAGLSGLKDSILYSRTGADATTWNEHILFTGERIVLILAAFIGTQIPFIQVLGSTLAFVLTFSMVHNSAYYYGRSVIDKTDFDIRYSSSTSTAILEFGFKARLMMFILGLIVQVTWMIIF